MLEINIEGNEFFLTEVIPNRIKALISEIEDFLKNDLIQSGIGFLVEISQLKQQKD